MIVHLVRFNFVFTSVLLLQSVLKAFFSLISVYLSVLYKVFNFNFALLLQILKSQSLNFYFSWLYFVFVWRPYYPGLMTLLVPPLFVLIIQVS
jgi:hypothetical protein